MQAVRIVEEEWEVGSTLDALGTSKSDLTRIVTAAVAAKADFTPHDPANAAGQLSYIYGTRALRDVFCPKGWEVNRHDNIESVYCPKRGVKIIFQNADSACDILRDPKAISDKGPAAERAIERGQGDLFPELLEHHYRKVNASIIYLFVHINGSDVRAELSRPKAIESKQFDGFHERIFLIKAGEWTDVVLLDETKEPVEQDFDISVTRKA